MRTVRVVTDSTADLGQAAAERGIAVVPLTVSFGDATYEDGVTIDSRAFFERLAVASAQPTTSQPTPAAFEETYRRLVEDGATGIVSIHISSNLSGTCATAMRVADDLCGSGVTVPIVVVDSKQASLGMHFGIFAAHEAARNGAEAAEAAEAAREALARSTIFMIADDLGYLQRGGRIGQAQRVVGTLLNVKPIVTLREGGVVALESPRTRRRAYERVAEYIRDLAPVESIIVGQSSPDLGDQLESAVRQTYDGPISRMWAGPTIGSHIGPGCVGLSLLRARQ
jgi:DegV family protein with EDD domain